jgi:hypothetical protein
VALAGIICARCNSPAPRRGPVQKYCEPCSDVRNRERQARWVAKNPPKTDPAKTRVRNEARRAAMAVVGSHLSSAEAAAICGVVRTVDPEWIVRVAVPFSYKASKNAIYTNAGGGHVAIRRDVRAWRDYLTVALRTAMGGHKVKQNKLWLDIFVQKTNHKGDAVNVVDLVCDAVKVAVGLDDRWFSIRRVDWEIVKSNPRVFVGISQEDVSDVQACSCCGRLLTFDQFGRNRSRQHGISRECLECRRAVDRRAA